MPRRKRPKVTFGRAVLRTICETAAANPTECVGMLVGRRTGPERWRIDHMIMIAHCFATEDEVHYYREDVDAARVTAVELHAPNEGVGVWHSHPWESAQAVCVAPQLDDTDKRNIVPGDLEVIAVAFDKLGFRLSTGDYVLQRSVGCRTVRVEAYWKSETKRVYPCEVCVR